MQMLGIENVVELSYAPKRRNVYLAILRGQKLQQGPSAVSAARGRLLCKKRRASPCIAPREKTPRSFSE